MSSWDRTRSIPWSRALPVAPASPSAEREDVDLNRERVFRDLAREAAKEKDDPEKSRTSADSSTSSSSDGESSSSNGFHSDSGITKQSQEQISTINKLELNFLGYVGRPYQFSDLLRNTAFGATIGSITGMCFGFMDSLRSAQTSTLLKNASNSAKGKFIFQGTYRSGMFFGGFFGAFHTVKYGVRVLVDPGDVGEIGLGSVVGLGAVFAKREWRASLPYAVMLVGMDTFHVFMRDS
mmetsp:Transcript_21854/g.43925  ORF Transcript_21854/g.43925 Transcript_21854/m.43925 type:complete len:237 (+) Transcript_21854:109-819(+)